MKTRSGIVVVLIAIVAMLLWTAPVLAASQLNPYEQQLLGLVNRERARHGLPALHLNAKLVDSARAHSADMGAQKYFSHDSASGEAWSSRIIRFGYTREGCKVWKAGENIYYGAGLYSSPAAVVDTWMHSSAHRQVILTQSFRDIGVGAVKTDHGYQTCQGTVWFFTLDLGRRIVK